MLNTLLENTGRKVKCHICGKNNVTNSSVLKVCLHCIRNKSEEALQITNVAHKKIREEFTLPPEPPRDQKGIQCNVCVNECKIGIGKSGYCGLRKNVNGKLKINEGILHTYLIHCRLIVVHHGFALNEKEEV